MLRAGGALSGWAGFPATGTRGLDKWEKTDAADGSDCPTSEDESSSMSCTCSCSPETAPTSPGR